MREKDEAKNRKREEIKKMDAAGEKTGLAETHYGPEQKRTSKSSHLVIHSPTGLKVSE